jgi:hypothetical protein
MGSPFIVKSTTALTGLISPYINHNPILGKIVGWGDLRRGDFVTGRRCETGFKVEGLKVDDFYYYRSRFVSPINL